MMTNSEFLAQKGADAFLSTDEKTMWYFTRFLSSYGYVVLLPGKTLFLTDLRYKEGAEKKLKPKGIEVKTISPKNAVETLASVLSGAKKVGYQADAITVQDFRALEPLQKEWIDFSDEVYEKESVKTAEEIALIQKACRITEKTYLEILTYLKEGVTELEVANEMEYRMKKAGATGLAFETIVAFGKNAAVPHHVPDNTKLKEGMAVLMDFGCSYEGYCSDMTRTVFFGEPTKAFRDAYAVVLHAHLSAREAVLAGVRTAEADKVARDIIDGSKYQGLFTHSLGHGVGVHIHERPSVSPASSAVFAENMVFTDEPGIYKENKFGIRIEDTLRIENGKAVSFMKTDKKLVAIVNGKVKKYQ